MYFSASLQNNPSIFIFDAFFTAIFIKKIWNMTNR